MQVRYRNSAGSESAATRAKITLRTLLTGMLLFSVVAYAGAATAETADSSGGEKSDITIGMVLKTLSNPYFGAMKSAAQKEAKAKGVELIVKAGKYDGDVATQIAAIETLTTRGVDALVIVPNVSSALSRVLKEAKQQGTVIIAADTALQQKSLSTSFVATNNFRAGKLNGRWARKVLEGKDPVITLLEGTPSSSVNRDRMNGFLKGFGIDKSDVAIDLVTHGARAKALKSMENALAKNPNVNLVWTINEPAAFGAARAIKEYGKTDEITLVTMDGSCRGIRAVKAGKFDADVMQFPARMATKAIDVAIKAVHGKDVPSRVDTGEVLITKNPQEGVPSKSVEWGLNHCWGK